MLTKRSKEEIFFQLFKRQQNIIEKILSITKRTITTNDKEREALQIRYSRLIKFILLFNLKEEYTKSEMAFDRMDMLLNQIPCSGELNSDYMSDLDINRLSIMKAFKMEWDE